MLTPFGKEIRKLRIDHQTKMKDLADKLGVSSAFISAVEMGRKSVPEGWLEKISTAMDLNQSERKLLEKSIAATANRVSISLDGAKSVRSRELATAFARRFPTLTKEEIDRMFDVLTIEKSKE